MVNNVKKMCKYSKILTGLMQTNKMYNPNKLVNFKTSGIILSEFILGLIFQ